MPIMNIAHEDKIEALTPESTDAEIRANAKVREEYGDLLDRYPNHPVVISSWKARVLRWQENKFLSWLIIEQYGVNRMWENFHSLGDCQIEDIATIYRMMGYSLCGFVEVFGDKLGLYAEEESDG